MSGSNQQFRVKTFLVALIILMTLILVHTFALMIKEDVEKTQKIQEIKTSDLPDSLKNDMIENLKNQSIQDLGFDDLLSGFVILTFGVDLPMPFPLLLTALNILLLFAMVYAISYTVRSWIPFLPGD